MGEATQGELFGSAQPPHPTRTFLGWDRPLVELALEFLLGDSAGKLSTTAVVVPTRQSARRLRDAFALAGEAGRCPRIVTPEFLYSPPDDVNPRLASQGETLFAWALTLQQAKLSRLRNLFPVEPPDRGFNWAMGTAHDLLKLRTSLGEAGLLIGDVPDRLDERFGDVPRWQELANLERLATERLADAGLQDSAAARQAMARNPRLEAGIGSLVLIGLPDPPPVALQALEGLATSHEIHVAVYAQDSDSDRFDHWGRPTDAGWAKSDIDIPDPDRSIQTATDPASQSAMVADAVAAHESPEGLVAVGVADAELAPHLIAAFAARDLNTHLPGGLPFSGHELQALLRLLSDLVATRAFPPAAELARHPDFLDAAAASYQSDDDTEFDPASALAAIDHLAAQHLPATLSDALAFAKHGDHSARHLLGQVTFWADRLTREPLAESLPDFLSQTFAAREFDLADQEGATFSAIADSLRTTLDHTASLGGERFSNADALELAIAVLRGQPLLQPRQGDAIDLHGWLEMLWEDSPHLVIAGANDGKLPEAMGSDSFLPNKARKGLGIRDSNDRLVRDSYLLSALLAPRNKGGRVDLFLGRISDAGDPLRPSRLLFRCDDAELPARALRLCGGEGIEPPPAAPWQAAWKLQPPSPAAETEVFERISVTGFRSYLACPFRFYLRAGLGMDEVETDKFEMNARDFGTLCHDALEAFGEDEAMRDSTSAKEIRDFLIDALEQRALRRYGRELSVPLTFQLESAKQRLTWAAERQVKERAAGWRIERTEWRIHRDHEWQIGGLTVRGTIDRIERHEKSGDWRVLDYKTSSKPKPPRDAHLAKFKRSESPEDFPAWAVFDLGEKAQRWVDLQLPLYVLALKELEGADNILSGYFNLAPSAGDTALATWDDIDDALLARARACAEGISAAIRSGEFWPPTAKPTYDDFDGILFGDAESLSSPPQSTNQPIN